MLIITSASNVIRLFVHVGALRRILGMHIHTEHMESYCITCVYSFHDSSAIKSYIRIHMKLKKSYSMPFLWEIFIFLADFEGHTKNTQKVRNRNYKTFLKCWNFETPNN